MSIRGSAAVCGLVFGCCLVSSAFGEVDTGAAEISIWQAQQAPDRPATAQLEQGIIADSVRGVGDGPLVAGGVCFLTECQLPDQMGHGAGMITGATSDGNPAAGFAVADNFVVAAPGSVDTVCWWGFYFDFGAQADCGPGVPPVDAFTVTYYLDGGGGVPGAVHAGPFAVVPAKVATGAFIGTVAEYEYSAAHPPVSVVPGLCYWIEIQNNTTATCFWLWETAAPGDGLSAQDADGDGLYNYLTERNDFDLAWCLGTAVVLADPTGQCDLVINPACGKGAGECNEANGTPGCEDEVCCTLTCNVDGFCCDTEWDANCVNTAGGVGCVFIGINCTQPPPNCQFPDQLGHGAGGIIGATSDNNPGAGFAVADNFVPESDGDITEVCWWGLYNDFVAGADCGPGVPPVDAFTIKYYDDGEGVPGSLIGSFAVTPTKAATGAPAGLTEYEFTATHAALAVLAGECYWIEIQNTTTADCFWLWETAPGDGLSAQETGGDGYQYLTDRSDYDLAFCVNIATSDFTATCELEIDASCGKGAGACEEANGTPGCEDEICCALTCNVDAFCCDTEWDINCVNNADTVGCVCIPGGDDEGVSVPVSDNFDSYTAGVDLVGVNGWGGWDDIVATIAEVRTDQFLSAPNSLEINAGDDQVQQYLDAECAGQYVYSIQQYIPSNMIGTQYFILLNTYADGGTKNWSTQVQFTATTGVVSSDFEGATLPLITDQWVEIRVEIDLDANIQDFYYGGDLLVSKSWTEGVSTGGFPAIRAVDLFANGATAAYYDDVDVSVVGVVVCPWDCALDGGGLPDPDGAVATADLLTLLGQWNAAGVLSCDFDGDMDVSTGDLLKLLGEWGPCE